jgi:hypothetical protein
MIDKFPHQEIRGGESFSTIQNKNFIILYIVEKFFSPFIDYTTFDKKYLSMKIHGLV